MKIKHIILGLLALALLLGTIAGATAYGGYGYTYGYNYYYGAGGYPVYDGHQYHAYGPGGWNYYRHSPSIRAYWHPYPYHYGYHQSYYHQSYYRTSYPGYYYRGYHHSPWYSNYWPYNYRVYQRWYP
jgi:hypothetical protein